MSNEEARMRAIRALFAVAAIAGGVEAVGASPADAQCSVFSRRPCVPNVCSVLSRHPCVPEIEYPFSEDLRLTIMSARAGNMGVGVDAVSGSGAEGIGPDGERKLDTIRDMYDALRACWLPPPQDEARPGMQMSVRFSFKRDGQMIGAPRVTYASPDAPPAARTAYHDAIAAALARCTPLPFSSGLGGALAGRPIAIRYVDNRNAE
jgi:hypothetical protein